VGQLFSAKTITSGSFEHANQQTNG